MKEKHIYRIFLWSGSVFGVVCFIFANSLLPADASSEESKSFLSFFVALFPELSHYSIRKLAHVAEYALLGAHLALAPIGSPFSMRVTYPVVLLFGAIIAFIDEGIQRFVPGRGPSLTDALIDFVGYLAALILVITFLFVISKTKKENPHVQR